MPFRDAVRRLISANPWLIALTALLVIGGGAIAQNPEIDKMERLRIDGGAAYQAGEYDQALSLWQQGLASATAQQNQRYICTFLVNISLAHWWKNDVKDAFSFVDRAIVAARSAGIKDKLAFSLRTRGQFYRDIGEYDPAIKDLKDCLTELGSDTTSPLREQAETYLGTVFNNIGDLDTAAYWLGEATAHHIEGANLDAKRSMLVILNARANLYHSRADFDSAIQLNMQALAISTELNDTYGIATALNNLGNALMRKGDYAAALEQYTNAIEKFRTLGDRATLARALGNLGNVYLLLERTSDALITFQEALDLKKTLNLKLDAAETQYGLAVIDEKLGHLNDALTGYLQCGLEFTKFNARQSLAIVYYSIGCLYGKLNDLANSEKYLLLSKDTIEKSAGNQLDPDRLGAFQDVNTGNLYARLADVKVRKGMPEAALLEVEHGLSQGLQRQLSQNLHDGLSAYPDDQRLYNEKYKALEESYQALNGAEEKLKAAPGAPDQTLVLGLRRANEQVTLAHVNLRTLRDLIAARHPDLRVPNSQPSLDVRALRALTSLHRDTLFIEWSIFDHKLSRFYVCYAQPGRGHVVKSVILRIGSAKLDMLTKSWRDALTARSREAGTSEERDRLIKLESDEPKWARALGAVLLDPIERMGLLPGRATRTPWLPTRLVFVLDGPLRAVPVYALIDSSGRRLVERCPVSVAPSLSTLVWPSTPRRPSAMLFCAADPTGPAPGSESTARAEDSAKPALLSDCRPVKEARDQVAAIQKLFPNGKALVGPEASKAAVLANIDRFAVLHFATHGVANIAQGIRSYLALAPLSPESTTPTRLEAREIMRRTLSARLAVLSACETALGQTSGGDGLLGLPWAFRAAGCPTVVASLWSVDARPTRDLMVAFYRALYGAGGKPAPVDEAMQRAMLTLMRAKGTRSAFDWAAFQVNGDTTPVALSTGAAASSGTTARPGN